MRRRTIGLVFLVAILALVGAGCGGSDDAGESSVDAWAEGFCTAVTSWTGELQQIASDVTDPSSLNADALNDAAASVSSATDAFVDDVRGLGTPGTESGEDVRSAVDALADTIDTEKSDIEEAVDGISDITDIPAAVSAIGTSLDAMGIAFQNAMTTIEDADVGGELETAFEQADACDEISS